MAAVLLALAVPFPLPARASSVWPQKATAPFYCLDGGKGWKQVDRYDIYEYDTLPSPLTETQTKRLFWAYPSNWTALKEAARMTTVSRPTGAESRSCLSRSSATRKPFSPIITCG